MNKLSYIQLIESHHEAKQRLIELLGIVSDVTAFMKKLPDITKLAHEGNPRQTNSDEVNAIQHGLAGPKWPTAAQINEVVRVFFTTSAVVCEAWRSLSPQEQIGLSAPVLTI